MDLLVNAQDSRAKSQGPESTVEASGIQTGPFNESWNGTNKEASVGRAVNESHATQRRRDE